MNTRLKIICILFSIAYLFVIGDSIYEFISANNAAPEDHRNYYELGHDYGVRAANGEVPNIWMGVILPVISLIIIGTTIIALFIYIPIKTYRVIRSVIKDNLFDLKNIKRIRMIGYALIIAFVLSLAFYPLANYMYANLLQTTNEMGSIRDEYLLLLMGLLVLLFAEVMKISHSIKEENELTV